MLEYKLTADQCPPASYKFLRLLLDDDSQQMEILYCHVNKQKVLIYIRGKLWKLN